MFTKKELLYTPGFDYVDDDIRCNQNKVDIIATDRKDKNCSKMIEAT